MTSAARLLEIMLVEDNPGDIRLTKEVLAEQHIQNHVTVAKDGDEALQILQSRKTAHPDLILLDLNLPRRDGRELLKIIKSDEALSSIPVIVLTTSNSDQDVRQAYHLHANCYIVKPVDLDGFFGVVEQIENFWFKTALLPRCHE